MNTIKLEGKKPLMVAHRGCSGLERENTHAAFVAAGNRTYYGIETDVHKTADGKYVAIHDDNTKRTGTADLLSFPGAKHTKYYGGAAPGTQQIPPPALPQASAP